MKKIKDAELREYQHEIGQKEYKKFQTNYCNKSARLRDYNLRASRQRYENSEEKSLISSDYARNWICDFILGKTQDIGQSYLFTDLS